MESRRSPVRGHVEVELFWYTEKGVFWKHDQRHPTDAFKGRLLLRREDGRFVVQWSEGRMEAISASSLSDLRTNLKDYLDSLRTKSLAPADWPEYIVWQHDRCYRVRLAMDKDGQIVRTALWDEDKGQYVSKDSRYNFYRVTAQDREPFSEDRWQAICDVEKATEDANSVLDDLRHEIRAWRFRVLINDPALRAVYERSLRQAIKGATRVKDELMKNRPDAGKLRL
jgi:hypothetical protein